MKYKYIIALDPSGAFWEGKGTTGYSIFACPNNQFVELGKIQASQYPTAEAYYNGHLEILSKFFYKKNKLDKNRAENTIVVIEDYLLYADKAASQINSRMETSKLIGIIQLWCYNHNIPYAMQLAATVKSRWTDEILHYKGYLKKSGLRYTVCEHTRDSMRHAVHYATFKNKE